VQVHSTQEKFGYTPVSSARHTQTVRVAIRETFPNAITLNYLKRLHEAKLAADGYDSDARRMEEDNSSSGSASQSEADDSSSSDEDLPKAKPTAPKRRKAPAAQIPEPAGRTRARFSRGAMGKRFAHAVMLACFGITVDGSLRARTGFKPSKLHMHNDTLGAPGVAVYATRHICLNARVYDYEAAFLPPEPRNQSDARKRPDKDKWIEAEEKELTTLWDMGTFVLTDALPDHDLLPLQFVYKLKVKDRDFDNCINQI
jgi:hypothetical protein